MWEVEVSKASIVPSYWQRVTLKKKGRASHQRHGHTWLRPLPGAGLCVDSTGVFLLFSVYFTVENLPSGTASSKSVGTGPRHSVNFKKICHGFEMFLV